MNVTGKRRLLKLAEFLETAKIPGQFDMENWALEQKDGRPACGTSACAMGWATTIPSFRRAGLKLDFFGDPVFRGRRGSGAAAVFFNISYESASDLFVYYRHASRGAVARRAVAQRIRKFVRDEQKRAA